jgi:hypothetical protein
LSARAIAGAVTVERFEGGDDLVQVGLDAAQVLGQALLALGVGLVLPVAEDSDEGGADGADVGMCKGPATGVAAGP